MANKNEVLPQAPTLDRGYYRHYKGDAYSIVTIARDCEDPARFLVVYKSLRTGEVWSREYSDFVSTVVVAGKTVRRFAEM